MVFVRVSVFISLFFLSCLFAFKCVAQTPIDSLENRLDKLESVNTEYVDILNELSFEYLKSDPEKGILLINEALEKSDSLKYTKGMFRGMINKGNAFWMNGLFDQALRYFLLAITHGDKSDQFGYTILYNSVGEVYKKQGQYDSSFNYYFKALNILKENSSQENVAEGFSIVLANIAETHFLNGSFDSASFYYEKTYNYALKNGSVRGMSYALAGLGTIEQSNGNYNQAIDYHLKSLMVRRELNDKRAIIQSLISLTSCYLASNQISLAFKNITEAENIAESYRAYDLQYEVYYLKSEVLESLNRFQESNTYMRSYLQLKDSLESQATLDRIQSIKSALESEIHATENRLLKEEQAKQEQYLMYQVIIIAAAIILVFILIGFVNQYYKRLKQQQLDSKKLEDLNKIILKKNEIINEINKNLDNRLIITSKMLVESQKVAKLGSWEFSPETQEINWTDEIFHILGIEPGSITPSVEALEGFLNKSEFEKLKNIAFQVYNNRVEQTINIQFQGKNGQKKIVQIRLIPQSGNDRIERIFGTAQDITNRIQEEESQLEISRSLLELSKLTSLKELSFGELIEELLYKASITLNVNRAGFWLFNKDEQQLESFRSFKNGKFFKEDIFHPKKRLPNYFKALNENRTIASVDVTKDKRVKELTKHLKEFNITSLIDAQVQLDGQFIGVLSFEHSGKPRNWSYPDQRYVGSIADLISTAFASYENKKLVREKQELIDQLVSKNQNLKEFTYVISHNLRDPVAQLMGLSGLLVDQTLDENTRKEVIKRIKDGTIKLDMVIKDLSLVLSSQENKNDQIEDLHFRESVDKTIAIFSDIIEQIKPEINLNFREDLAVSIPKAYLTNIIYNLLSNSIKYRKRDEKLIIDINAVMSDGFFTLEFQDNGIGFDSDTYKDKIFQMYQRFHLDIDGRGIGLYIVKSQIEQLGGIISVSSKVGQGTVFKIRIPQIKEIKQVPEVV